MDKTLPPPSRRRLRPASARRPSPWRLALFALASAVAICSGPAAAQRQLVEPEQSTGWTQGSLVQASRSMIVTANRHASEAGREMLRGGGSATDAAIAAQLVLGLVEPQSSGLGGGAFLLHWDKARGALDAYDGRETAPAAAQPDRFLRDGQPMPFETAVKSGLSIGTPGTVRLLSDVHRVHGKLAWSQLFEPAIRLAESGFAVSPRLHILLRVAGAQSFDETARRYFFDSFGVPHPIGHILKNPAYAATLRAIAAQGPAGFYTGSLAEEMVKAAAAAPNAPGDLTVEDLRGYRIEKRAPVCAPYRGHKVCGMGPPSSGGIAIAQILTLLEPFDLGRGADRALNGPAVHLIVEAEKLAYADRDRYIADPAFVPVPAGLTDGAYLAERRKAIDAGQAMPPPMPGLPPGLDRQGFGLDQTVERAGTSHISVIDRDGNAVAMTTTIEGAFGSGVMTGGFLLNNELTDFSMRPVDGQGRAAANRIEPGKRPRSTMAPTLVFDQKGQLSAVLGSPGGGRIVLYAVKALVGLIDWELNAYEAASLTNFGSMGGPAEIEIGWSSVLLGLRLKSHGHSVRPDLMNSGLNILAVRNGVIEGGSDPRREGAALGD